MSDERFKVVLGVINIITRYGRVLLLLRKNKFDAGLYSLPGGCLEKFEHAKQVAIREIKEETNLTVKEENVEIVSSIYRNMESWQSIELVTVIKDFTGELINMEPDKSERLEWHHIDNLPKNMSKYALKAIENYRNKTAFAEVDY
jgi:ADP-ribose pyrophosphatase YjhB (NUDIX family)